MEKHTETEQHEKETGGSSVLIVPIGVWTSLVAVFLR